jgi:hypothetical protein
MIPPPGPPASSGTRDHGQVTDPELIRRAEAAGIAHRYRDWRGEDVVVSEETLNAILPKSYYAMAEQVNGGFGPDILALQLRLPGGGDQPITSPDEANSAVLTRARPRTRIGKETEGEFYQRKQRAVTIRHISGDRLVAVVDGGQADSALAVLRAHPLGEQAAIIGYITADQPGIVLLKTAFGGTRIVDLLVGDPLPRIC